MIGQSYDWVPLTSINKYIYIFLFAMNNMAQKVTYNCSLTLSLGQQ